MQAKKVITAIEQVNLEFKDLQDDFDSQTRDEVSELLCEFMEDVYRVGNISDIERRIQESRKIDADYIRTVLDKVAAENPRNFELIFSSGNRRTVKPREHLSKIKEELDPIVDGNGKLGSMELGLRLELRMDPYFDEVLMSFPGDSEIFKFLIEAIKSKLKRIDKDEVLLLWARIKNSFSKDRRGSFVEYNDIIPADYWRESSSFDDIIDRVAHFVGKYKALTILKMIGDGYNGHPAGIPGVCKILSVLDNGFIRIQNLDLLLVRTVSRIVVLYKNFTYKETSELAKSIGANSDGLVFDGDYYREYDKFLSDKKITRVKMLELLITNLKRAFEYAQESQVSRSQVADAIWHYKLGQEIIFTKSSKKKLSKELDLQKEVSKFLAERGILSYGRQFGRSEIDLYTKEMGGEDFAIEVKVYKGAVPIKKITNNLVQLMSYMDQLSQPRGVLVIYNFGSDVILAPRKWIKGRIWILAINLCSLAPNRRSKAIEIFESSDEKALVSFTEHSSQIEAKPFKRNIKISKAKPRKPNNRK